MAKRFFSRRSDRTGVSAKGVLKVCPWDRQKDTGVFCYECHEVLLHNPVLLKEDIELFALLVKERGLSEKRKPVGHSKLEGRIMLLHEVIERGLKSLVRAEKRRSRTSG